MCFQRGSNCQGGAILYWTFYCEWHFILFIFILNEHLFSWNTINNFHADKAENIYLYAYLWLPLSKFGIKILVMQSFSPFLPCDEQIRSHHIKHLSCLIFNENHDSGFSQSPFFPVPCMHHLMMAWTFLYVNVFCTTSVEYPMSSLFTSSFCLLSFCLCLHNPQLNIDILHLSWMAILVVLAVVTRLSILDWQKHVLDLYIKFCRHEKVYRSELDVDLHLRNLLLELISYQISARNCRFVFCKYFRTLGESIWLVPSSVFASISLLANKALKGKVFTFQNWS